MSEETRADGARVAYPLFQAEGGGSIPTSALQLRIEGIGFDAAKNLNAKWHSRLPKFAAIRAIMLSSSLCYGAEFDGLWYAVAIWTNPVARLLPQDTWLELRRLAIAPDAPKYTASRMLAVMTRLIRKDAPHIERLVSYQDTEVHTGGIYKAAGWDAVDTTKSCTTWDMPNRKRAPAQSTAPKRRWEKPIA